MYSEEILYMYDKNVEWGSFSFEFGGKVQYILYLTYPLNIRLFHTMYTYTTSTLVLKTPRKKKSE